MTEKTTFHQIVPAMVQDKAADWLIENLDEDLRNLFFMAETQAIKAHHIEAMVNRAEIRGKIIRQSFIAAYSDEPVIEREEKPLDKELTDK